MKKIYWVIVMVIGFAISSCSSEQSLQQYFIASSENPNFMSFDLPSSLLNLEKVELSETQKKTASSLKKLNILAFQKKDNNTADYEVQKAAIKTSLILVRVLGDDMNPASFVQLIQAMEKSDFDGKGLEQLGNLIKG